MIKKFRDTEFSKFQLKDIEFWVNLYYKEFVEKNLMSLDFDVLEILELGTFTPKKKTLIKTIVSYFKIRRKLKGTKAVVQVEATLRKLIQQYWYLRKENEKRKRFGIKKLL